MVVRRLMRFNSLFQTRCQMFVLIMQITVSYHYHCHMVETKLALLQTISLALSCRAFNFRLASSPGATIQKSMLEIIINNVCFVCVG